MGKTKRNISTNKSQQSTLQQDESSFAVAPHVSVLLKECVVGLLKIELPENQAKSKNKYKQKDSSVEAVNQGIERQNNAIFVDCTFGAGGHTREILKTNQNAKVIAIDRDGKNESFAVELNKEFGGRITFVNDEFVNIDTILKNLKINKVDGFLYDVGVSSMQIDDGERGFSFQKDGPLDMRMNPNAEAGIKAFDVVNLYDEKTLADIIYKYGDERKSFAISRGIVKRRQEAPIETTLDLASIVCKAMRQTKYSKIHPATRTFQAIRIEVNDELTQLEQSLNKALPLLKSGGRISVVTFHSLEDRIVKSFMNENGGKKLVHVNRHDTDIFSTKDKSKDNQSLTIITKKPIEPTDEEVSANIRARSAKLRIAEKI